MAMKVVVVIGGPMVWVIIMEDGGGGVHEMRARGTGKTTSGSISGSRVGPYTRL